MKKLILSIFICFSLKGEIIECPICLEALGNEKPVVLMNCCTIPFHKECIERGSPSRCYLCNKDHYKTIEITLKKKKYEERDPQKRDGILLLEEALLEKSVQAAILLGNIYNTNIVSPQDIELALAYYHVGLSFPDISEEDYHQLLNNIGYCCERLGRKEYAFNCYKRSAQKRHDAQFNVAICYFYGIGVEQDIDTAVKWLFKARENGSEMAKRMISEIAFRAAASF